MNVMRRHLLVVAILSVAISGLTRAQDDTVLGKSRNEWLQILDSDPKTRMRKASVIALGIYGPHRKEVLPALIRSLANDKDEDVRLQIVAALGQLSPKAELRDALPVLADAVKDDKSAAVRAASATLLGNLGENARPALMVLIAALKDAEPAVRAAAAETIGKIGEEAAKIGPSALLPLLKDPEVSVRYAATFAFGRLGPDAALMIPDLIQVLETEKNDDVRREAARSLVLMGGSASRFVLPAVLKGLSSDPSIEVRRQLAQNLTKMGDLKGVSKELFDALKAEKDRTIRLYLVRAIPVGLGSAFKDSIKEYAELIAGEPEADVRLAIILEIGAVGPPAKEALDALAIAQNDVVLQVREAAKNAMLDVKGITRKEPPKK